MKKLIYWPCYYVHNVRCKIAFQKQGEKNIAYLCCSIGNHPWSPSNNGRPQLSVDQSKHYHYRANQQVGLVRL